MSELKKWALFIISLQGIVLATNGLILYNIEDGRPIILLLMALFALLLSIYSISAYWMHAFNPTSVFRGGSA